MWVPRKGKRRRRRRKEESAIGGARSFTKGVPLLLGLYGSDVTVCRSVPFLFFNECTSGLFA